MFLLFFSFLFVLQACFYSTAEDPVANQVISCTKNIHCPESYGCYSLNQKCIPLSTECVQISNDHLVALADGNTCHTASETASICLQGKCETSFCGDHIIDTSQNEQCDLGEQNNNFTLGCTLKCQQPKCGDGFLQPNEQCDDGNTENGDGCRADCQKIEVCGDGELDVNEECDDGNDNPADRCDLCLKKRWSYKVISGYGLSEADPLKTLLNEPNDVFKTLDGCVYIATKCQIFKLSSDETSLSRTAGLSQCGFSGDGESAANAQFDTISSIYITLRNRIYIADTGNNRIRLIDENGIVSTVAGGGFFVEGSTDFLRDGSLATDAFLNSPMSVFIYSDRNYIADAFNSRIRMVDEAGIITTIAGNGNFEFTGDGGPATEASLSFPYSVHVANDIVYISDAFNNRIRTIDKDGMIDTFIGNGECTFVADGLNPLESHICNPSHVHVVNGKIYILDTGNNRIRTIDSNNHLITVAGNGVDVTEWTEGTAALMSPIVATSIFVEDDQIYFTDFSYRSLRKINSQGFVNTIAGNGSFAYQSEGQYATAVSVQTGQIAVMNSEIYYVENSYLNYLDLDNQLIRKIDANGLVATVAGNFDNINVQQSDNPLEHQFSALGDLIAFNNEIFFVDDTHQQIYKIDTQQKISIFAGNGTMEVTGNTLLATDAAFTNIKAIYKQDDAHFYIIDEHQILMIDQNGMISTIAGSDESGFSGEDSLAADALFSSPSSLTSLNQELYIADTNNHCIRKIFADGQISTFAGICETSGLSETGESATTAKLELPSELNVHHNQLYFLDADHRRVCTIDSTNNLQIIAGVPDSSNNLKDGNYALGSYLDYNTSMASDADNIYLSASYLNQINKIDKQGMFSTVLGEKKSQGTHHFTSIDWQSPKYLFQLTAKYMLVSQGNYNHMKRMDFSNRIIEPVIGRPQGYNLGEDPFPLLHNNRSSNRANYFRALNHANGIAFDGDRSLYISERDSGNILVIDIEDIDDIDTWSVRAFAGVAGENSYIDGDLSIARFVAPSGLKYDPVHHRLLVVESKSHTLRAIDLNSKSVTTIYGHPGLGAAYPGYLDSPQAVVLGTDGAIFISDTNNNRVLRIETDGTDEIVIGTGEAGSSGEGSPARDFPVNHPFGLDIDSKGNLFITSANSVRLLLADAQKVVKGDAEVITIYGKRPNTTIVEQSTRCLSGIALRNDETLEVSDECQGYIIELTQN